jgi:hypothetical protein
MTSRDDRMTELFDYLVLSPQGVTIGDMIDHLDCNRSRAETAIHDLREFLGQADVANLTCTPNGSRQQWLYHLETKLDEHKEWIANRTGDFESRLRTMLAMLSSVISGTSSRTLEGKRARVMHRQITRLLEDLQEMDTPVP